MSAPEQVQISKSLAKEEFAIPSTPEYHSDDISEFPEYFVILTHLLHFPNVNPTMGDHDVNISLNWQS